MHDLKGGGIAGDEGVEADRVGDRLFMHFGTSAHFLVSFENTYCGIAELLGVAVVAQCNGVTVQRCFGFLADGYLSFGVLLGVCVVAGMYMRELRICGFRGLIS